MPGKRDTMQVFNIYIKHSLVSMYLDSSKLQYESTKTEHL